MKTYNTGTTSVRVYDGHPETGDRSYERFYIWKHPGTTVPVNSLISKGWILYRREEHFLSSIRFTFYRKKHADS